jgi:hypothetical protein
MKKTWIDIVPPRSLVYVACCCTVLAAFIAIVLLPSYRSLGALDHEIEKIESSIETQQVIMPLYMQLLKKTEEKCPPVTRFQEKKRYPRKASI